MIPVASILIPTGLAIILAAGERKRSIRDRAEERRRAAEETREEQRRVALDRLFDCLLDSVISDKELDSDAGVMKVRRLNSAIGRLGLVVGSSEPWLTEWLAAEHTAMAINQVGAKLRKTSQKDSPTERARRAGLLNRYVVRANELSQHIVQYELEGRPEELALRWKAEADEYTANPLGETLHGS